MLPTYVALTALTSQIRIDELAAVAAALQTQVTRDFGPIWGSCAVIAATSFEAIPAGHIPIIVQDTLEAEGANGFHRTRTDDTPYILLPHGPTWSLAASHELLRMLANPSGSARRPGSSCMPGQGTVEYLIDVCAPCQDVSAAYAIDGIIVSDFCTPAFFGPKAPAPGAADAAFPAHGFANHTPGLPRSFNGAARDAFAPAPGGVVTWLADDSLLYQARADHQGRVRVHGGFSPANRARMLLRELVDVLTPNRLPLLANAPHTDHLLDAEQNARRVRLANMVRFRDDIAWRYGHAAADRLTPAPQRPARRLKTYGVGDAKSGQQRPSDDVETTLRTAS